MTPLIVTHEIEAIEISAAAHQEIADALRAAGHDRAFSQADIGILIDMTGFGLVIRAE